MSAVLMWLAGPALAADTPLKVVVVRPADTKVGTWTNSVRALERSLGKSVSFVPLADYLRAGKSLGIKPLALLGDESAVAAGRLVGATHVLFVSPLPAPTGKKGGKREEAAMKLLLVDTATGASSYEAVAPQNRLASNQVKAGEQAALALVTAATQVPQLAAVVPPPAADGNQAPASPTPPGVPAPSAAVPPVAAAPANLLPPLEDTPPPASAPPAAAAAQPAKAAAAVVPSYFEAEARLPHGVEVSLGGLAYQREALIGGELQYGASSSSSRAPLFGRGTFDLLLLPGRFYRHRLNAADGVLAFVHAEMGVARTYQRDDRIATLGSYAFRVGGGYRAPLWEGPRAMVASLKVGFSQSLFASHKQVAFPAVGVRGTLLGLGLEAPLGTRHLALVGDFAAVLAAKPFSTAADLGARVTSGLGGVIDTGARLSFGPVDVSLLYAWERYSIAYGGPSHASNVPSQFSDTRLVDQNRGAKLKLGLHF